MLPAIQGNAVKLTTSAFSSPPGNEQLPSGKQCYSDKVSAP